MDHDLRRAYEQSQVRSVIDSYHGRLDAFAEGVQNAIDAVEKRWSDWSLPEQDEDEFGDNRPRIRIILNFDENALEIIDNGTGIEPDKLEDLLEPFVTDKRALSMRGHKGVGTTFLAYGHPYFEIHTKTDSMSEAVGYAISGGRAWATGDASTGAPDYILTEKTHPSLTHYRSGTFIKVGLNDKTSLRSLQRVRHNSALMWAQVLRSTTAVGNVRIDPMDRAASPAWMQHIEISLEHPLGKESITFSFPFPSSATSGIDAKEMRWLQRNPSARREYDLIYIERNHVALRELLRDELAELENSDEDDAAAIVEAFNDYEVSVYASLAYKNTFYDEQFKQLIGKPNAERLTLTPGVGGGVMVASVGMPMGALQSHLSPTMQPQERRRYFLLVHFNEKYSPDIGRKTIPQAVEPLVDWLERELLKLLRTQAKRLSRDREAGSRPGGASLITASQELNELIKRISDLETFDDEMTFGDLVLQRSPHWEPEVMAVFTSLLTLGVLPGYKIRAMPGASSRYDALIDYRLTAGDQDGLPDQFRVTDHALTHSGLNLTGLWLEFKQDINAFIEDLDKEDGEPSKKYFNHVSVLVTWSVRPISSDRYGIEAVDSTNKKERTFVASTHFLQADGNDHKVEVICLQQVISTLFGDGES
ncbi:ATP-binding protein [Saccharothrix sp. NPDC042600]|uniref:ATP-binding protein n=1 Tax=Saccharothrix TaxID=2071 RepID=UPI0033C4C520